MPLDRDEAKAAVMEKLTTQKNHEETIKSDIAWRTRFFMPENFLDRRQITVKIACMLRGVVLQSEKIMEEAVMATKLLTDFCSAGRQEMTATADVVNVHGAEAMVEASGIQNAEATAPADAVIGVDVDGRQTEMQTVPAEAGVGDRQEMQAEEPAEIPEEADASSIPAEHAEIPAEVEQPQPVEDMQDGTQDGSQILPAEEPAEGPKEQIASDMASAEAMQAVPAGSVASRFLPPKREKPQMVNVTMRLTPNAKAKATRLAHDRDLSLSEFCAQIVANVVAVAEDPSQTA